MASGGRRPGAGRPPKLPTLRLARGTKFKPGGKPGRAVVDGEVLAPGEGLPDNVPAGMMIAPVDLSDEELRFFASIVRKLEEQKRASPHYDLVVTLLARRLAEVERLSAVIAVEGDTFESRTEKKDGKTRIIVTVMKRVHPAAAMRSEAMRHAQSLLGELMLSPVTALKLGRSGQPDANQFDF